jgi:nifR3 family TIM-barrel protein
MTIALARIRSRRAREGYTHAVPAAIAHPPLARPLTIGPIRLATNLLLAPVANYCDLAWRLTCREQGGVGLACTDLLSPQGLLRGTAHSLDLAMTVEEDRPLGMQLYGGDGAILAEGALWAVRHGATLIDINMGCPVDKVTKKDGGSKLLCDPARTVAIAANVVREVERATRGRVPVTAKMRLGWSRDTLVAPDLAIALARAGIAAITVHGRTADQHFRGIVDLAGIRDAVDAVRAALRTPPPIIGNGDVLTPGDARRMIEQTGCDGVMIGRGSFSKPWIFRQCWEALQQEAGQADTHAGNDPRSPAAERAAASRSVHARPVRNSVDSSGNPYDSLPRSDPTDPEIIAIIRRYFRLMLRFRGEHYALNHIRRRISWLGKPLGPCKPFKETIRTAPDADTVERALDDFLAGGLRDPHHAMEAEAAA